jgi:hypothetical protein
LIVVSSLVARGGDDEYAVGAGPSKRRALELRPDGSAQAHVDDVRPVFDRVDDRFQLGAERKLGASGAKDHELACGTDPRSADSVACSRRGDTRHMASVSDRVVLWRRIVPQNVVADDVIHIAVAVVIDAVARDLIRV